jgi:hypothetical protein
MRITGPSKEARAITEHIESDVLPSHEELLPLYFLSLIGSY